jgi:AcrR family transcriptional regulator
MARGRSSQNGRSAGSSEATRTRIVEATLATIRTEGILGASARAIARTGSFNQASIYYHFGSINDVVIAAVQHMSRERLARYEHRLARVSSLPELVQIAAELHQEDVSSGTIKVLSQVMAGAAGDQGFAKEMADTFDPWVEVVSRALHRALDASPLGSALPIDDLAYAVSALFVGVELLGELRDEGTHTARLFAAFEGMAHLVDSVLRTGPVAATVPSTMVEPGAAAPPEGTT